MLVQGKSCSRCHGACCTLGGLYKIALGNVHHENLTLSGLFCLGAMKDEDGDVAHVFLEAGQTVEPDRQSCP